MIDRLYQRFPYTKCGPAPRYFRRGKLSGFANVGRICRIVIPRRRGRCLHRPTGRTRFMAVFRRIRGIVISRRRGGRLCPPAGNARFHGNPMRTRNILTGRCGHRPLQTSAENRKILEGGQGRPPLQRVLKITRVMRKNAAFRVSHRRGHEKRRISHRRGRCPH